MIGIPQFNYLEENLKTFGNVVFIVVFSQNQFTKHSYSLYPSLK